MLPRLAAMALALVGCAAPPSPVEPDPAGVPEYGVDLSAFREKELRWAREELREGRSVGWSWPGITEEMFKRDCIDVAERGGRIGQVVYCSGWLGSGLHIDEDFACREMLSHGYLPVPSDKCQPWQLFPKP